MAQRPTEQRRPSVYDVAARAGVSIATVSRVLRSTAPVSSTTRERVLAAASELEWRPSRRATAFAARSHGAVGIVFPSLGGPYYPRLIAGFEECATERGIAVLITATHGRRNAPELVADLAERVDGLVVTGSTVDDVSVRDLAATGRAVVLLGRSPVAGLISIRAANTAPARELTEHVIGHGCQHVVFVGDPALSPDIAERWRGVRTALRSAGLASRIVATAAVDTTHGYKAGLDLFDGAIDVDAVICANDELAAGIVLAAGAAGRRVPDDVVVTGWDDAQLSAEHLPPLTTVHQPIDELGRQAAGLLFAQLDGDDPRSTVLPASVLIRRSCGCPSDSTTTHHHHQRGTQS